MAMSLIDALAIVIDLADQGSLGEREAEQGGLEDEYRRQCMAIRTVGKHLKHLRDTEVPSDKSAKASSVDLYEFVYTAICDVHIEAANRKEADKCLDRLVFAPTSPDGEDLDYVDINDISIEFRGEVMDGELIEDED